MSEAVIAVVEILIQCSRVSIIISIGCSKNYACAIQKNYIVTCKYAV